MRWTMWWADFYIRRVHSKISTIISFWMDTTRIDVIEWKWWWNEEKIVALNVFLFLNVENIFFSAKITYIQNNDALTSSLWKKKNYDKVDWNEWHQGAWLWFILNIISTPHRETGVQYFFFLFSVSILNELFGDPQMIGFSPYKYFLSF